MSFKEKQIKSNYESGIDDLLNDFYIPVLSESIKYDRIAGYFSSTSLAISAKGIANLIKNSGRMRLIASPHFTEQDLKTIESVENEPTKYIEEILTKEISSIENDLMQNHLFALGWMLSNNLLEIKIAIVLKNGKVCVDKNEIDNLAIFHQKVGIFEDKYGNIISFSGSINETSSAWLRNVEEFKVFKNWIEGQNIYCSDDVKKFNDFWNCSRNNVKIIPLPEAVRKKMISIIPRKIDDSFSFLLQEEANSQKSLFDFNLFFYQKNAVQKWLDNKRNLICEMATGTGKTRVALACISNVLENYRKVVIVIACPQNTLSLQWKEEVEKLNIIADETIIVDSTNVNWKVELETILLDIALEKKKSLLIYTTHQTNSSDEFIKRLESYKYGTKYFFIGDEAHGLGANKAKNGLKPYYDFRLALSATPKRWFDNEGTDEIYRFFKNDVFEFTIKDALNTINPLTQKTFLVNYMYIPIFVTLSDDELEEYLLITKKIGKFFTSNKVSAKIKEMYENLLFKRANIIKNAEAKYPKLIELLDKMKNIEKLLIFVSPEQLLPIMQILMERDIKCHKITENEGTKSSIKYNGLTERQFIIEEFKKDNFKALVAIKCLDEGIDIPSATTAILLSNSSNPREYVQRIGRVIRQSENKHRAVIYDFIVKPLKTGDKAVDKIDEKIFNSEKKRIIEIASNAINNAEALKQIYDI